MARTMNRDRECPACERAIYDDEPTTPCSNCGTLTAEGCVIVNVCKGRHPYACGNNPDCEEAVELGCCQCRPTLAGEADCGDTDAPWDAD